jgi:uncharacterized membrane protein YadS
MMMVAIAGIGLKSDFSQLMAVGAKPIALILVETIWIAGIVLSMIYLMR